jgi:hypothetical protein
VESGAPLWQSVHVGRPNGEILTHGFGVAEAIKVASILDCLPRRPQVFGIEGRRFDGGGVIPAEVVSVTKEVAKRIAVENSTRSASLNAGPILTFNAE